MGHLIKFVGDVMDKNYDVITFISNAAILRRPGVANFIVIIKMKAQTHHQTQ